MAAYGAIEIKSKHCHDIFSTNIFSKENMFLKL